MCLTVMLKIWKQWTGSLWLLWLLSFIQNSLTHSEGKQQQHNNANEKKKSNQNIELATLPVSAQAGLVPGSAKLYARQVPGELLDHRFMCQLEVFTLDDTNGSLAPLRLGLFINSLSMSL